MNTAQAPGARSRDPVRRQRDALRARLSAGEFGALPVVVGLVGIAAVFQSQNSAFLSAGNLTNLMLQISAVGTISVGVFLVLLLGEIDLSVGSVSGVCAALLAVLNVKQGMPAGPAIALALLAGAAIGTLHGLIATRFGVPTFVVTLAGLIGWQGLQLYLLKPLGTINLPPSTITELTTTFLSAPLGWALAITVIAVYTLAQLLEHRARTSASLRPRPLARIVTRSLVVGLGLLLAVAVLNADRGVPLAVLIFVSVVVCFDLLTTRTRYGRHIFAVGGNAEAARRAGIPVNRIRVSVFALASMLAAAGGVLAASRLISVSQATGGGDVVLNAIAAAVIGGTSLFGGRGSAYASLLGILVIGSISNGMDLLGLESSVKFMITGVVLIVAVILDSLARRGRQASGR